MLGKKKCKILKEIRQKIADENDIPFVTQECTFQGECKGTCPKCESELRYLEDQLAKRQRLGKTVTVAALAASLMTSLTACPASAETAQKSAIETTQSDPLDTATAGAPLDPGTTESADLSSDVPYASCEDFSSAYYGYFPPEETFELEGDIAYSEPDEPESELIVAGMLPVDEGDGDE